MEELINLPGVGRKSANVIMLEAFNNPQGIAIDTHAKKEFVIELVFLLIQNLLKLNKIY